MELFSDLGVGTRVVTKQSILGCTAGTYGVCFHVYNLGGRIGYQFLFANGQYDGFSEEEVHQFLNLVDIVESLTDYEFENVIQLGRDYKEGKFHDAFYIPYNTY